MGWDAVCKERFVKGYRHPDLDRELTLMRMRSEVRNLLKCRSKGVACPAVLAVRPRGRIVMQRIRGETLAAFLQSSASSLNPLDQTSRQTSGEKGDAEGGQAKKGRFEESGLAVGKTEEKVRRLAEAWADLVADLHDKVGLVHGDLTSSNVMIEALSDRLVLIDLGLAQTTTDAEDRAVDLYVLQRAMHSNHAALADDFLAAFFDRYAQRSDSCRQTLKRLDVVRLRGRKRTAFG